MRTFLSRFLSEGRRALLLAALLVSTCGLGACGARQGGSTTPNQRVEMEGMRIVARHDGSGGYSFESYDAEELFKRANVELDAGRCPQAVALYDRLVSEFPGGRFASAALYNSGLCLAQTGRSSLRRSCASSGWSPSSPARRT